MRAVASNPPRDGEGDQPKAGGGGPAVLKAPIKLVKRVRMLRKQMSLPEVLLWRELQKRPGGYKFRKQFPQAGFSVDFVCLSARLALEVDGEAHDRGNQPEFDSRRDALLGRAGFRVVRIPAREVLGNMEGVIAMIVAKCGEAGPLHRPSGGSPPRAGEDFL